MFVMLYINIIRQRFAILEHLRILFLIGVRTELFFRINNFLHHLINNFFTFN